MRNFIKMVLLFLSSLILFIDFNVFAASYDLFIENDFLSYDEIERIYDTHLEKINEFESNLECSSLESSTVIEEVVEELINERFENFTEKERFINNLKNNGYSVSEKILVEDSVLTSYSFIIVNSKIISTKINDIESLEYNGLDYEEVLLMFRDVDNNDIKVINTIIGDTPVVNEDKSFFETLEEVEEEVIRLEDLGYKVNYEFVNDKYVVYYAYDISEYNVLVEESDKDYIVNASKTNYIVRTTGTIVKDETCGIGNEYEELTPPHTYVSENIPFNVILFYEDRKRVNR